MSIGANIPQLLIHEKYKAGRENESYAVRIKLGWVLIGCKSSKLEKSVTNNVFLSHSHRRNYLRIILEYRKLWSIVKKLSKMLTRDETRAMNILETATTLKNKHYERIVMENGQPEITNEQKISRKQISFVSKKVRKKSSIRKRYNETINQYISKGYARRLTQNEIRNT